MKASDFRRIEQEHRRQLNPDLPVVVRFDGKNVTKNHKSYHLMERKFTDALIHAAIQLVHSYNCVIYAYLDEVSIIFLDAHSLFLLTEDQDLLYSAVMILQDFKKLLPASIKSINFNISIFNIPKDQCLNYVLYRKQYCEETTLVYYAKEHYPAAFYAGKSKEQLRKDLISAGHTLDSSELEWFFHGQMFLRRHKQYEQIKI